MATHMTPAGVPVDIEKAIADLRRNSRSSDPLTLKAVEMAEDFATQLAVDFPDRADWPKVAHAVIVSTSMNGSLVHNDDFRRMAGIQAANYVTMMLNIAALGAVELLDRLELANSEVGS